MLKQQNPPQFAHKEALLRSYVNPRMPQYIYCPLPHFLPLLDSPSTSTAIVATRFRIINRLSLSLSKRTLRSIRILLQLQPTMEHRHRQERIRLPSVSTIPSIDIEMENVQLPPLQSDRTHRTPSSQFYAQSSSAHSHARGRGPNSRHGSTRDSDMQMSHPEPITSHSSHNSRHFSLPSVHEMLQDQSERTNRARKSQGRGKSASTPRVRRETPSTSRSEKQAQCDKCGKWFKRKSDAVKHRNTVHSGQKNWVCKVCKTSFARKDYCQVSH